MLPSLKRTTFVFVVLLTLILSYLPMPVSSLPIAVFQDRKSHAPNSFIDDQLVFDISFAFVLFIAMAVTCLWITARMTIARFISYINQILAISIALVEQVVDQLYYLRLDTILRVVTSLHVDANDGRDSTPRRMGGQANPTSPPARSSAGR